METKSISIYKLTNDIEKLLQKKLYLESLKTIQVKKYFLQYKLDELEKDVERVKIIKYIYFLDSEFNRIIKQLPFFVKIKKYRKIEPNNFILFQFTKEISNIEKKIDQDKININSKEIYKLYLQILNNEKKRYE